MSVAVTASIWEGTLETTTVRRFLRAVGISFGAVAVGCLIYLVERFGFDLQKRFVENPADVMVRVFGMAHFVVGWLYLFSSPRLRNRRAGLRLTAATLLGGALCAGFAWCGGISHPLLKMAFYGYFLFHELGDETMFYQAYGDHAATSPREAAFLRSLGQAAAMVLFAVLAACYLGGAMVEGHRVLKRLPEGLPIIGLAGLGCVAATLAVRAARQGQALYGSLAQMVRTHRPVLTVYALLLAILVGGSFLGTTGLNFIILIHVSVWIVFIHWQLGKRPARTGGNLWTWLRSQPTGFLVLHVGVAAGFLVLMALRVHVWERAGIGSELLASKNFCYWGLMHISMSFWSSR